MGFPRQEYWSGLPFLSPGDSPSRDWALSPALAGSFFTTEPPGKPKRNRYEVPRASTTIQCPKQPPSSCHGLFSSHNRLVSGSLKVEFSLPVFPKSKLFLSIMSPPQNSTFHKSINQHIQLNCHDWDWKMNFLCHCLHELYDSLTDTNRWKAHF